MRNDDPDTVWSLGDFEEDAILRDAALNQEEPHSASGSQMMGTRRSSRPAAYLDPGYIGLVSDDQLAPAEAPAAPPKRAAAIEADRPQAIAPAPLRQVASPQQLRAPQAHSAPESPAEADQPVPRIRMHAACDRHEVARLVQAAASDRRLARAEVSIELGGIEAAIARYAGEPSPDLLLIDSVAQPAVLLAALDRLSEVIEANCKVVIIGASNDIQLYRRLIRMGVSEYLVTPIETVGLLRALGALYVNPDKPFAGRTFAFLGARGGVGASALAHNVAWCVAERQAANATLVDLDLPFGTAALDFNEDPSQSIHEALAAADRVDEVFLDRVMTRPSQRLQLFTAPARLERALDLDAEAVSMVLDRVRRTGPHIFLDLPHAWTSWMTATVTAADDIIIVASPDLACLRNAKNIVDFATKARPNDNQPILVMNMVGVPKRPEIPSKEFAEHVGVPVAMEIPFDPAAFGAAANNGQMLGQAAESSKAFQQILALAARLTGREVAPQKRAGLLDRIGIVRR